MPVNCLELRLLQAVHPRELIGEFIANREVSLSMIHHLILKVERPCHVHDLIGDDGVPVLVNSLKRIALEGSRLLTIVLRCVDISTLLGLFNREVLPFDK